MEGINFAAILLTFLGIVIFGIAVLVALGLLIARKTRAALLTFAGGLLALAIFGAWATLSFLERGHGFHQEGAEPTVVLVALSLLLAGGGQFGAAFRGPATYAAAFACTLASALLVGSPTIPEMDVVNEPTIARVFGARSLSVPWVSLGLALSLLFGVLSVIIAWLPARRRHHVLLLTSMAVLGGIAGFACGETCVATRTTIVQGMPGGMPSEVRVDVKLLGTPVSDEVGHARIPREGLNLVRAVSARQAAWVYGPLALGFLLGGTVGLLLAYLIARLLLPPPGKVGVTEPDPDDWPMTTRRSSSDQIKPV